MGRRLVLLAALSLGAWIGFEALTLPDVAVLAWRDPETTAFIELYQQECRRAGKDDQIAWEWTLYTDISPHLKRAVLVAEDINFFSHRGFDLGEMKEALREALKDQDMPRGASTITQQLARNLWLSPSRNPLRKIREAVLTWQLERHLSKRRILELYLNVVELGPGIYGAGAAARHYFREETAHLTEEEAAQLAASLPNPTSWHPGSPSPAYARHVARIERRMEKAEFLWDRI